MPYSITTKDGIVISNIPDSTPKDDPSLKALVAQLRASGQIAADYGPSPTAAPSASPWGDPNAAAVQTLATTGEAVNVLPTGADLGAVARGVVGGVGGLVTMVADPITTLINTALPPEYQQLPPSQALQIILDKLGVPRAETEAQKILQATTAGLAGGGANVAASKAASAVPGVVGAIGKTLAAEPVQQMMAGAGSGFASETAAQMGAPVPVQMAAGIAGGALAGKLAGVQAVPSPVGPVSEAGQAGIRLLTSDVRPPNTFAGKWIRSATEKVPLGTGSIRAAQQGERIAAVRDIVRQYGAEDLAAVSDDVMSDLIAKRSADVGKWAAAKNDVIESLSKTSMGTPTPMTATTQKIDETIASLQSLKTAQVQPVIALLDDWKQAIQGQDLANIEILRKQVGEAFKAPDMAAVRTTGEKALSGIYSAVNEDMGAYIKAHGGEPDYIKWKVANTELSKLMGEMELGALKRALTTGDTTPENVKALLFSAKKSDVAALYRNLSDAGQASARSAVIAKAAEDARIVTENAGEYISPDKFMTSIKKMGNQVGVMFSGDDLNQVQGLMRVLDYTKRAAAAGSMPSTGIQLAIPAGAAALSQVFGSGINGFVAAMGASAGVGLTARAYESKAVRDILSKLPSFKVGSPEEAALLKRLVLAVQTVQANQTITRSPGKKNAMDESPYAMPNQGG